MKSVNPHTLEVIQEFKEHNDQQVSKKIDEAHKAFYENQSSIREKNFHHNINLLIISNMKKARTG